MRIKTLLTIGLVFFLLLVAGVYAAEFNPLGNIIMKNTYGVHNVTWINMTPAGIHIEPTTITGATWMNSTSMGMTNLEATNLEKDLDGTGYQITAGTFTDGTIQITGGDLTGADDVNCTEVHATNLFGTGAGITGVLFNTGDTATGNYTFGSTAFKIDDTNDRISVGKVDPLLPLDVVGSGRIAVFSNDLEDADLRNTYWGDAAYHKTYFGTKTSADGGMIVIVGNRTSAGDITGAVVFESGQSTDATRDNIIAYIAGVRDTDVEAGYLSLRTHDGGTTITEGLRVLSDANVYIPNALGIGTTTPENRLHVLTTATGDTLKVEIQDAGKADAHIVLFKNSTSPANGDDLGSILFEGDDSTNVKTTYVWITTYSTDITNGAEDGRLNINWMNNGATSSVYFENLTLYPSANNTYKLGATTNYFSDAYITNTHTGHVSEDYGFDWSVQAYQAVNESGIALCLDKNNPGWVKPCTTAYDITSIGVTSENFDCDLQCDWNNETEEDENCVKVNCVGDLPRASTDRKIDVAYLGKYYALVECDKYNITVGDVIVSSNTAGYGQSFKTVTPATILQYRDHSQAGYGKAMEGCTVGDGKQKIMIRLMGTG